MKCNECGPDGGSLIRILAGILAGDLQLLLQIRVMWTFVDKRDQYRDTNIPVTFLSADSSIDLRVEEIKTLIIAILASEEISPFDESREVCRTEILVCYCSELVEELS